jgi:putative effector of murein hydrolase
VSAGLALLAPLGWPAVTLSAYAGSAWLYRRGGQHALLLPVLTGTAAVVLVLGATGTPYHEYFAHARVLYWQVGPATVALAVPLFGQLGRLRRLWLPLGVALLAGSLTAIVSAVGIAWALGGSPETLRALAPKSATMPIALPVAERLGGPASLAAVAVAVTGIAGAALARGLLDALRIRDAATRGFALGVAAHAIGTARALQTGPVAGAFAALAMGLNGIATAVLVPVVMAAMGLA